MIMNADDEARQRHNEWHALANEIIHIANNLTVGVRVENRLPVHARSPSSSNETR